MLYYSVYILIIANLQSASIFNRSFQRRNLTQIGEFLTEIGLFETHDFELTTFALTILAAYAKRTVC